MHTIMMLLEFGSMGFYTISIAMFILVLALSENDREYWAGASLVGFVVMMNWIGSIDILTDPLLLLQWSVIYIVVGVLWSFVSWLFYLYDTKERLVGYRYNFLKKHNIASLNEDTKVPSNLKDEWINHLKEKHYLDRYASEPIKLAPSFMDNKLMIGRWIIWWPTSFVWTMLSNPVMRFGHWIARRLKNVYQRISDKVFADFE